MAIVINELKSSNGVAFGELHNERASCKFLISQMKKLKDAGITALFVEFVQDNWQKDLDAYHEGSDAQLPKKLLEYVTEIDLRLCVTDEKGVSYQEVLSDPRAFEEELKQPYSRSRLIQAAKQNGIRVIALESANPTFGTSPARLNDFNDHGVKIIHSTPFKPGDKYGTLTGLAHMTTTKGVPGLKERLQIPAFRCMNCASQTICRPAVLGLSTKDFASPDWVIASNPSNDDPNFPTFPNSRSNKCSSRYLAAIATAVAWVAMTVFAASSLIKK